MTQVITAENRQKLIDIVGQGLVNGLGTPRPGDLCVEAAICLAMGEPHSDKPSCVAEPDRQFAIRINDAPWSSPEARAEALLPLALAQLGTAGTDRGPWVRRVVEGTIRQILPIALRVAARVHPEEQHCAALDAAAMRCEQEGTRTVADTAAAARATSATYDAAQVAHAAHAAYFADAAAAASADARHAAYAAANAAAYAADANAYAAAQVAHAAHAAYFAAAAAEGNRDDVLRLAVQIALDAYAAEGRA